MKKRIMLLVLVVVLILGLGMSAYADPNEGVVPKRIIFKI